MNIFILFNFPYSHHFQVSDVRVSLQRVSLRSVGLAVLADDVRARVVVAAAAGSATRFLLPVDFGGNGWKTRRGIGSVGPRRRNPIRWLRLGSFAENIR